jgi:cytidylate kinase
LAERAVVIAIDGPSASGKGTLARRLARHLGLRHLDTGALYRAVALRLLRSGVDVTDAAAAARAAAGIEAADLAEPDLRAPEVAGGASIVAAMPGVRAALLDYQRRFASEPPGAVLDGRDVGTVVCPGADVKLYLDADPAVRADRRLAELRAAGARADGAEVAAAMAARDRRDAGRDVAPLRPAADAVVIDTTDQDAEAVFRRALAIVGARLAARP